MLPMIRATYQSKKTGQQIIVLGINALDKNIKRDPISYYEVCLIVAETWVYSEIPLAWFNAIYEKISDTSELPDDLTIIKPAKNTSYIRWQNERE